MKIITFTKNGMKEGKGIFVLMSDISLDKFQGLIQMKDATAAQSAKLVISLSHNFLDAYSLLIVELKWSKYLSWLLHITNRFF